MQTDLTQPGIDATVRLSDQSVIRVATVDDRVVMTTTTDDGMVTVSMSEADANLVDTLIDQSRVELVRRRLAR